MQPTIEAIDRLIDMSLAEDVGMGDITSSVTIDEQAQATFEITAGTNLLVCGLPIAARTFLKVNSKIALTFHVKEGQGVKAGDVILSGKGNARAILMAERVALNLLRLLTSVATTTRVFVEQLEGTNTKLLDTRKTFPGLREFQKYAVLVGGGYNHRFRLDDGILIKDNHLILTGGVAAALERAKRQAPSLTRIEVECETLEDVKAAVAGKADIIMCDNMGPEKLKEAVALVGGAIPIEASGSITLKNIKEIAQTGVDFISTSQVTQSPLPVDVSLSMGAVSLE